MRVLVIGAPASRQISPARFDLLLLAACVGRGPVTHLVHDGHDLVRDYARVHGVQETTIKSRGAVALLREIEPDLVVLLSSSAAVTKAAARAGVPVEVGYSQGRGRMTEAQMIRGLYG